MKTLSIDKMEKIEGGDHYGCQGIYDFWLESTGNNEEWAFIYLMTNCLDEDNW